MYVGLGHPFGGARLTARAWLSCSVSVEVPLVTNMSLGSVDLRRRGAIVCVSTCVDVVFTLQLLSHT